MSPHCADSLSFKHTHTHAHTLKIAQRKTQSLTYKAGGEPVPLCYRYTRGSRVILSSGLSYCWKDPYCSPAWRSLREGEQGRRATPLHGQNGRDAFEIIQPREISETSSFNPLKRYNVSCMDLRVCSPVKFFPVQSIGQTPYVVQCSIVVLGSKRKKKCLGYCKLI